ncbi:MAG: hypothetical protein Q8936_19250 [Bacillota bacterium]|nr:hypothetical protein [Bacillota bacterium]
MEKKQIIIITIFTIVITCLDLCFQWSDLFGLSVYSTYIVSFPASLIFLLVWLLFSFYWGLEQEKKYQKFITIYWGCNIVAILFIAIFPYNQLIQEVLYLLYIWCEGPIYGLLFIPVHFPWINEHITKQAFMLITAPLGMVFSFIGFRIGLSISKFKKL